MKNRKNALMSSVIAALFVMTLVVTPTFGQAVPSIRAPIILDTTKEPSTTFTIDILVQDAADLWGFQFTIKWDPDILTCIGAFPVPPFVTLWPSEVGTGTATIAASLPLGVESGVSGTWVLAYMNFRVEALGSTFLDLQATKLQTWDARDIDHTVEDGYFANVEPRFKVEIQRSYPEHRTWSEAEDKDNTLHAVVKNFGLTTEAIVTFTVTDEAGLPIFEHNETRRLSKRERLDVTWDILKYDMVPYGYGTYYVTTTVKYYDVDLGVWDTGRSRPTYSFTFVP